MTEVCAKVGHASRAAAVNQKVSVNGRRGQRTPFRVYRCDRCEMWHIGRTVQRVGGKGARLRFEGMEDDGL